MGRIVSHDGCGYEQFHNNLSKRVEYPPPQNTATDSVTFPWLYPKNKPFFATASNLETDRTEKICAVGFELKDTSKAKIDFIWSKEYVLDSNAVQIGTTVLALVIGFAWSFGHF